MIIFGVSDMVRGVIGPSLLQTFHINYAWLGFLFSISSIGYLISSFFGGFLLERFGQKKVMLLGTLLFAVGFCIIGSAPAYIVLAIGYSATGLGSGVMEIAVNSIVPQLFTVHQSRFFNLLHGFYGTGATVAPLVAAWLIVVLHTWRYSYVWLAAMTIVLLFGVVFTFYPPPFHAQEKMDDKGVLQTGAPTTTPLTVVLKEPLLYLLIIAIMIYVTAEGGMANWLPTYLHAVRGFTTTDAANYLSAFYLTFTIGRFAGSVIVHRIGSFRSIIIAALIAFVADLIPLVIAHHSAYFFIIAGFFYGIIFPTISSLASEMFPKRTATVMSLLFTFAALGSIVATWLIGVIASSINLTAGFIVMDIALLVTGLLILVVVMTKRFVRS